MARKEERFNRIFIPCLKQIGVTFIMDYTNYIQFFLLDRWIISIPPQNTEVYIILLSTTIVV